VGIDSERIDIPQADDAHVLIQATGLGGVILMKQLHILYLGSFFVRSRPGGSHVLQELIGLLIMGASPWGRCAAWEFL